MDQNTSYNFREGATLLINKPVRWTSFDVVKKIRNVVKVKTGHSGTLDPMATGLLIICTGKFTKKLSTFQELDKEYTGTFTLGTETTTYDKEGEVTTTYPINQIHDEMIYNATKQFMGTIKQVPPKFSALKVKGQPMYKLARKNQAPTPKAREITIKSFAIDKIELPEISFRVACTKGTYIRSLAYDFGKALCCGAHLSELCRTRIGPFHLEKAWDLDSLITFIKENND